MTQITQEITDIVKSTLNIGIIHKHDNLVDMQLADADDMGKILDAIEAKFKIKFNFKSEMKFAVKSIFHLKALAIKTINEKQQHQKEGSRL